MVMNRSFFSKLLVILTIFTVCTRAYAGGGVVNNGITTVQTDNKIGLHISTEGILSTYDGVTYTLMKNFKNNSIILDTNSSTFELLMGSKTPAAPKTFDNLMERTIAMTVAEALDADKVVPGDDVIPDSVPDAYFEGYLIHGIDAFRDNKPIILTTGDHNLTFDKGLIVIGNRVNNSKPIIAKGSNKQLTLAENVSLGLISIGNQGEDGNANTGLFLGKGSFYSLGNNFISYFDKAKTGIVAKGFTSGDTDNDVAVRIGASGIGTKSIIIEGSEFTTAAGDGAFIRLDDIAINKKVALKAGSVNSKIAIKDSTMDQFILNASDLEVKGSEFKIENSTFNRAFFASRNDYHGEININFKKGLKIDNSNFNGSNVFILGSDQPEAGAEYDAAAVNIEGKYIIQNNTAVESIFLIKNRKEINFNHITGKSDFTGDLASSIELAADSMVLSTENVPMVVNFQGDESIISIDRIILKKIVGGVYQDLADGDINDTGGLKVVVDEYVTFIPRGDLVAHEIDFKEYSTYEVKADDTGIVTGKIELMEGRALAQKGKIKIGDVDEVDTAKLLVDFIRNPLDLTNAGKEFILFDINKFDIDANSHADGFEICGNIYYKSEFVKDEGKIIIYNDNVKDIKITSINNINGTDYNKFYAKINGAAEEEIKDYADNEVQFTRYFSPGKTFSDLIYINDKREEVLLGDKEFIHAIMVNKADGTARGDDNIISLNGDYKATFSNDFIVIGNKIADKKSIILHKGELVIGGKGKTVAFIRNDGVNINFLNNSTLIESVKNVNIIGADIIFDGNKVSMGIYSKDGDVKIGDGTGNLIINNNLFDDIDFALTAFIYSSKNNNEIIVDVDNISINGLLDNLNFNNTTTSKLELKAKYTINIDGNGKQIVFQTNANGGGILIKSKYFYVEGINSNNNVFNSVSDLDISAKYSELDDINITDNSSLFSADKKLKFKIDDYFSLANINNKTIAGSLFRVINSDFGEFDIEINDFLAFKGINIEGALFLSEYGNDPDKTDKIKINNFQLGIESSFYPTPAEAVTTIHNILLIYGFKKVEFGSIDSNTLIKNIHFITPFFIGNKAPKANNTYDTAPVHINGGFNITGSTIDGEGVFTINNRKEIVFESNNDVYISDNDKPALVIGVEKDVLLNAAEMAEIKLTGAATYSFNGIRLKKIGGDAAAYQDLAADGSDIGNNNGLKLTIDNGITYELLNNSEHHVNEVNFISGSKLLLRINADGTSNDGKFVGLKRAVLLPNIGFENAKVTGEVKIEVDVAGGKLNTDNPIQLNIFNDFDMTGITSFSFEKYYKYKLEFDNNGNVNITRKTHEEAVKDTKEAVDKTNISSNSKETIIAFTYDDYDTYIAEYFNNLILNAKNDKRAIESGVRAINPIEEISLASAVGEVASNVVHTATNYVSINRLSPRNNSKIASNYVLVADNGANLGGHKFIGGDPCEFWAKYLFNFGSLETKGSETKTNGNGFIVGVDKGFFSNKVKAGFAFMPNLDKLKNNEREIGVMSLAFSIYSRTNLYKFSNSNEIYINNTIGYVHSFNKDTPVGISKELNLEESKYSGNAFTLDGIAGYRFDNLELSTEFGLKYTYLNQSEYKNSVGNKVSGLNRNVLTMILGVKYDIPEDSLLDNLSATIAFDIDYDIMSIGSDKYTIKTPKREVKYVVLDSNKTNRFGTNINFDFNYEVIDNLRLSLGYSIRLASKFINNTLSFGVRYSW